MNGINGAQTAPTPGRGHGGGRTVVIGGGIAGLAAAHRLAAAGARVTLLEATTRLGGKLEAGELAGAPVDLGAESMLARRPEAVELARAVGLADRLQPPATATAAVWTRDALRPMPKGHVMGVPGDAAALAGLLSAEGTARITAEGDLPPLDPDRLGDDVAVGELVAARLGREVVDRLVEPLLGGVYAGDAYRISLRAAVPKLYEEARRHPSLTEAVRAVQRAAAGASGPAFMGIAGGIGALPGAVADAVTALGGEIRLDAPVHELTRTESGWRVRSGAELIEAESVVLAAPAWSASELLARLAPAASAELAAVEYASMALVTLAYRRADAEAVLPAGSGFLVPPVDGRTIKASTFSSRKWRWTDEGSDDLFLLRTSVGRHAEEEHLHREDAELVAASRTDLAAATGLAAAPVASVVTRWTGGLPQYPVGHLRRVERIRAAVAGLPGLAVCGAAYDGVGIPACVASAHRAADEILAAATLAYGTAGGGRE
ncbi:protoporphyrinogen oxidase [Streptomyces sp. ODS05-4]|uniref:protoporphyrinogen oxidase n=1 Tax=Streptomyces sp. ODS05-4 TaxID=2944939 RepID=UPI00210E66A9|nr:protoporphyrinogen oxidase [Streptomyces sp. ODS05-4]